MVRDRDRGRRGPTRLFEDAGGQQFVLEAAVVAILMVSTIVIVANVTPTGPGIEQPETHQRMRRSAQDVLDAMAAEKVPACRTVQVETVDGSMVSRRICSKSSQLVADLLKSMMANSTVLCDKAGKDVPDGTRVAVYVHGSLGSTRVCGEVVDASTPGGSVAAFYATSMAFNYTHVFTDLDAYNGNDPTALGNTVTSQANVHTTETRALQRVITVPTRRGWPVVPGGEALEAAATLEGGPVAGDRVMSAAGATRQSGEGDLPFAGFYGKQIKYCPDGRDALDPSQCDGQPEPTLEDDATYDWHLDESYFGESPHNPDVTFEVTINETANEPIEAGTRLTCMIPPDWDLEESDITVNSPPFEDDSDSPSLSGAKDTGWTLHANTYTSIQSSTPILQFKATPPNPSDTDTTNDPSTSVYVFRCWLSGDAHSVLDVPVHLDPSSPDVLPITSGVLVTLSPADAMGSEEEGKWGVSVRNPTSEDLNVTRLEVGSLDGNAIFKKLNLTSTSPEDGWRVSGLQDVDEKVENGDFEQGGNLTDLTGADIPKWNVSTWPPDTDRPTSIATDSLGQPHVFYSRASDGRLVHLERSRTVEGQPEWDKEILDFYGLLGPGGAVIDDGGTPSVVSDDVVHVFFSGLVAKNPDLPYTDDGATFATQAGTCYTSRDDGCEGEVAWTTPGFGVKGQDARVYHASRPVDESSWDLEWLSEADDAGGFEAAIADGSWHVFYNTSDGRLLHQWNGSGRICEDQDADWNNWACEEVPTSVEISAVDVAWDGSRFVVAVRGPDPDAGQAESDWDLLYCETLDCPDEEWTEAGDLSADPARSFGLGIDAGGTRHLAYVNGEGVQHRTVAPPSDCDPESDSCLGDEETVVPGTALDGSFEVRLGLIEDRSTVEILFAERSSSITGFDSTLRHAVQDPDATGCSTGAAGWTCADLDEQGSGWRMAAAVDNRGTMHVAHLGVPGTDLEGTARYANNRMALGDWSFREGPSGTMGKVEVGGDVDAVVDDETNVHVAYQDETTESVRYAFYNASSEEWSAEVVATGGDYTGYRVAITLKSGQPRIAYRTGAAVWMAQPTTTLGNCGLDGDWSCEEIGPAASGSGTTSWNPEEIDLQMGVDDDGIITLLYQDASESLTLAFRDGTAGATACDPGTSVTWTCLSVPDSASAGFPALAFEGGTLHVAWEQNQQVRHVEATNPGTGYTFSGTPSAFDTALQSGEAVELVAGDYQGTSTVWASYIATVSTDDPEDVVERRIRLAHSPSEAPYPGDDPDVVNDDCVNDQALVDWACVDISKPTGPYDGIDWDQDGDLVFDGDDLHGIYFQGGMHYWSTGMDGSCKVADEIACESLFHVDGWDAYNENQQTTALVIRNGTPWVIYDTDRFDDHNNELWVAKRTGQGDGSCPDPVPWVCEQVDPGQGRASFGDDPAIAVDTYGRAHTAHYDPVREALMYSVREDREWTTEQVDTGTLPLSTGKDLVGTWSSDVEAHVVYNEPEIDAVQYATNVTGSWVDEDLFEVDGTGYGRPAHDLALHQGTLHLVTAAENLTYASCDDVGSGGCADAVNWSRSRIRELECFYCDAPSVLVAPNGSVVVAYEDYPDIHVARETTGSSCSGGEPGWSCTRIAEGYNPVLSVKSDGLVGLVYETEVWHYHDGDPSPNTWHQKIWYSEEDGSGFSDPRHVVDKHDPPDRSLSDYDLAFGQGEPHVAYALYDGDQSAQILVARRSGSSWSNETVLEGPTGSWVPEVSLMVNASGLDRIVYELSGGFTEDPLRTAIENDAGSGSCGGASGWTCARVGDTEGWDWMDSALVDDRIRLGVTVGDPEAIDVFDQETDGWSSEKVPAADRTQTGRVGRYADIVLEERKTDSGRIEVIPHVSYYDEGNGSAKYATKEDGSWTVETVDRTGGAGLFTSIAVNGTGPLISYTDSNSGQLRFASRNGGSWDVEVVDDTGGGATGSYASMALDDVGRPWISYTVDHGNNRTLAYAVREGNMSESCGSAGDAGWDCFEADMPTLDLKYGTWSHIAIDPDHLDIGRVTILHEVKDGTESVRIVNSTNTATDCDHTDEWTCSALSDGEAGTNFPTLVAKEDGDHVGLFVRSSSEIVEVRDRVENPTPACLPASDWQCKSVHSGDTVSRPDLTVRRNRGYAVLQDDGSRTFLYGTNRGWGRSVVAGGINASVFEQEVGDRALRLERTFDDTTWDHERDAVYQDFSVGVTRNLTAGILELNWTKTITGDTGKLDLERFDLSVTIDGKPETVNEPTVVWREPAAASSDSLTPIRVPVDVSSMTPGTYRLRVKLDLTGRMTTSGSSATVQVDVDEVSLRTFENRHLPLGGERFEDPDDRYFKQGSSWQLAGDGGWEADHRFGSSPQRTTDGDGRVTSSEYLKIWNDRTEISGSSDQPEERTNHTVTEFVFAHNWDTTDYQGHPEESRNEVNAFDRSFEVDLKDDELPTSITVQGALTEWGQAIVHGAEWGGVSNPCETIVEEMGGDEGCISQPSNPLTDGGASAGLGMPECDREDQPWDDPCSAFAEDTAATDQDRGTAIKLEEALDQGSELTTTLRLTHDATGNTTTKTIVHDLDQEDLACESGCLVGPWDVTDFVQDEGKVDRNYTLEIEVEVDITATQFAGSNWAIHQITANFDNVMVFGDYGGGTAVLWTGNREVPAKSSQDWVFDVVGNGLSTLSSRERTVVDVNYTNDFRDEAFHMPRYGMFFEDIRPEEATCAPSCSGEGGGYDIADEACVHASVGTARSQSEGKTCYENDPDTMITVGIQQSVRDESTLTVSGGEGRYNTFASETRDGDCNYAPATWDLTAVKEALDETEKGLASNRVVEVGSVNLTLHSPVYGAPVWDTSDPRLQGSVQIPLCRNLVFPGAYVVEARLSYKVEVTVDEAGGSGTKVVEQTVRKVDYFTVLPPDATRGADGGDGDLNVPTIPSPSVSTIELRLSWPRP